MAQPIDKMLDEGIHDLSELERIGKALKDKEVKTAQIRKFFGSLKRIQVDFDNLSHEIILLEPRLAYAYGKAKGESKDGLKLMYNTLGPLVKRIEQKPERFKRFVQITEAIVAYHKSYGGGE